MTLFKHKGHEGHTVRAANDGGTPVRDGKGEKRIRLKRFAFVPVVSFVFRLFPARNGKAMILSCFARTRDRGRELAAEL